MHINIEIGRYELGFQRELGQDAELFMAEVALEIFERCTGIREIKDGEYTLGVGMTQSKICYGNVYGTF